MQPARLEAAVTLVDRLIRALVILAFAVMVTAAIGQVVFRFVVAYPLGWTEELARIMMIWWTFLCVAALAWRRRLLRIDALVLLLPPRGVHAVAMLAHLIGAFFVGWLALLSIRLVRLAGTQTSTALEIPYAWIYLATPVGLGLTALVVLGLAVVDLLRLIRGEPATPPALSG
jgi:TRAP-type transport system small permease protein